MGLVLSTASQVIGGMFQSNAAAQAATYNSQVDKINASVARQDAVYAGAAGEAKTYTQGLKNREIAGAIKTNQAASGVDVNKGSAVDVQASQDAVGQLDAMTIRSNAAREAYGYETKAASFENQARLEQKEASNDKTAGWLSLGSTLLNAGNEAGSEFEKFQQAGMLVA